MSRRSVTTVRIEVELRLPPGAKSSEAREFLLNAIEAARSLDGALAPKAPMSSLDLNSVRAKLVGKETVYL